MSSNQTFSRQKEKLFKRWYEEDYPGGEPRFQLSLLGKDLAIFVLVPISAILIFKIIESGVSGSDQPTLRNRSSSADNDRTEKRSQIISFQGPSRGSRTGISKRAPGTLVRVRLMNVVETFSSASVHAQIIDAGLGRNFIGGTLVGDAAPDNGSNRITMTFRFARYPHRTDVALPIAARAMSLDGTLGIAAKKKEGVFARAAIRSASSNTNSIETSPNGEGQDLKTLVARAIAAGLMQEFQSEAGVAHNQAQMLTLNPTTEFFVELTDYFPGQM